jgi:hypothetical protein
MSAEKREPRNPHDELTPDEMEAQLQAYHAALAGEFAADAAAATSISELEATVREFWKKNVPSAIAQIAHLSNNALSESVRFTAAKFIYHEALAAERAGAEDPTAKLLKELWNKGDLKVDKNMTANTQLPK